jgi:predicted ATPase
LARISVESVSALERGTRRAPHRETVTLLADALGLDELERTKLEAAADAARARTRTIPVPDRPSPSSRLPLQTTSFVGRTRDLAEIALLLESHRLVTITGSGGVGKTRAALEVAERFVARGSDVGFVDLSPVSDSRFIVGTLATSLGLSVSDTSASAEELIASLQSKHGLIVLDNCEHVIASIAQFVSGSLRVCRHLSFLATSRERLAVSGEVLYRLPSLDLPARELATIEEARHYAALELFIQRVTMLDPFFHFTDASVQHIIDACSKLGGVPLAIELAAARVSTLGLEAMNERLTQGLRLDGGARNLPARQQTMLATIGWSYALLTDPEKTLLERTSIFVGGFTLAAAEAVCVGGSISSEPVIAELLSSLVNKSLLTVTHGDGPTRYSMLETVKAFAKERLIAAGQAEVLSLRHAEWLAEFADWIDATRVDKPEHWLRAQTAPEIENVRAALTWAFLTRTRESTVLAARIVGGLRTIWLVSGQLNECMRWVQSALAEIDEERDAQIAAPLMRALVQAAGDRNLSIWGRRALTVFERVGDRAATAIVHSLLSIYLARCGRLDEAEHEMSRATAILADMPRSMPYRAFLQNRFQLHALSGRYEAALSDISEAIGIVTSLGDAEAYMWRLFRANVHFAMGHFAEGIRSTEEILAKILVDEQTYSREIYIAYANLALFRLSMSDVKLGAAAAYEALRRFRRRDIDVPWARTVHMAALAAALCGEHRVAAHLWWEVDTRYDPDVGRNWRHLDWTLISPDLQALVTRELEALGTQGSGQSLDATIAEALEVLR